jgi:hypothetical protein
MGPESRCSKGKIVQEEIDASKEKGSKKEETLRWARANLATVFQRPLEETFREVFYCLLSFRVADNARNQVSKFHVSVSDFQ